MRTLLICLAAIAFMAVVSSAQLTIDSVTVMTGAIPVLNGSEVEAETTVTLGANVSGCDCPDVSFTAFVEPVAGESYYIEFSGASFVVPCDDGAKVTINCYATCGCPETPHGYDTDSSRYFYIVCDPEP